MNSPDEIAYIQSSAVRPPSGPTLSITCAVNVAMLTRLLAIVYLTMAAYAAGAQTTEKIRIEEIKLTGSMTPVSLCADGITDVIVYVSNAIVGTARSGEVFVLANKARADADVPDNFREPRENSNQWWADRFVILPINRRDGTERGTTFQWSNHVGEFTYSDVRFFLKFVDDKFVGTYVVESVLTQGPNAQWMEDLTGATLVLNLYVLSNAEGLGTGFSRNLSFGLVTSTKASMVTGTPSELKEDFERLIRGN